MEITRGIIAGPQKICVYGPEGIGKSTFASMFPNTVFIDTEGSTKHMDVPRLKKPTSFTMLLEQVRYIKNNPHLCSTLALDTADWAERLCKEEICAKGQKDSIEAFGYGKGYTYLAEEFGRLLNLLEEVVEAGVNVVLLAHAQMRKFEQPDELGSYDRWEMKLEKKVYSLVKEWADMVLFANYKTYVVNVDNQGAAKGRNKVQGGERIMYTSHHPCWDAKNRHKLPQEIKLNFNEIKHCIPVKPVTSQPVQQAATPSPDKQKSPEPQQKTTNTKAEVVAEPDPPVNTSSPNSAILAIPKPLADLMKENEVTVQEIQKVVGDKGYYPADTPIENYDPNFISGVLVGAWPKVFEMIKQTRMNKVQEFCNEDVPF